MMNQFFVFGVNHHATDTSLRGRFAVNHEKQELLYKQAKEIGLNSLVILNTCNRTEIFGYGDLATALELYASLNELDEIQRAQLFQFCGREALQHLFDVASGLNSKVIGDLEVLGQVKDAFQKSKKADMLSGYMERLANSCTQTAKEVRHNTRISNGTTSLAYSIIKYLNDAQLPHAPCILLIGAGSFAKNITQNIQDYMQHADLHITNRTDARAAELAENFKAKHIRYADWREKLHAFDIVISAITTPGEYIISKADAPHLKQTYLLDMAVPLSIEPNINDCSDTFHLTIDELSKVVNNTIELRKTEIPVARSIIDKNMQQFADWSSFYQSSQSLRDWKDSLYARVVDCPILNKLPQEIVEKYINKSLSHLAQHIKLHHEVPQDRSQALAEFLAVYHANELEALQTSHS